MCNKIINESKEINEKKRKNNEISNFKSSTTNDLILFGSTTYRHKRIHTKNLSKKIQNLVDDAKKRHRSDLKLYKWAKDGFAGSNICEISIKNINTNSKLNIISKEESFKLSVDDFIKKYEKPALPVIIKGIPDEDNWTAYDKWSSKNLKKNYKNAKLKCGEDDKENTIRIKLKYFLKYMKYQLDDSPLYIFDSSFDDRSDTKTFLNHYSVPKYFKDDLFSLVGEKRRPPYRWFLIGPKRSGTCVHIDPLGSSAWNTLISGRKRWVLFPPHIPKHIAKAKKFIYKDEDDEAVNYFADNLPRMKKTVYMFNKNKKNDEILDKEELLYKEAIDNIIEFIQYPGETVFIPGGWWHGVLNLEDTVAITQNFCSKINFPLVWKKTRKSRKKMAVKWLNKLEIEYPKLAKKAKKINHLDNFQMISHTGKKNVKDRDLKNNKKRKKNKLSEEYQNHNNDSSKRQKL